MGPLQAFKTCVRKAFNFSDRATRSEFWWFAVICALGFTVLGYLQAQIWGWTLKNGPQSTILTACIHLLIALPMLAVLVRRSQDIGFHPVIVFLPAIVTYFRYDLLYPLALGLETMHGLSGPEARSASFQNPVGKLAVWNATLVDQAVSGLVALLMMLPTNFAQKIPMFRSHDNEVPQ